MSFEDLINRGVLALRVPRRHEPRTAVVLGVPRGGTSMVAGALHHLGVPMGERVGRVNFEDGPLSGAVETGNVEAMTEIIRRRNEAHELWGWKRPSAFKHLSIIEENFRDPYYLVVFRDVFAIANRRHISMGFDVVESMQGTLGAYGVLVEFLSRTSQPCLLLSYDKCLRRPEYAVREMADFLGMEEPAIEAAARSIEPAPEDYLESSHRGVLPS